MYKNTEMTGRRLGGSQLIDPERHVKQSLAELINSSAHRELTSCYFLC